MSVELLQYSNEALLILAPVFLGMFSRLQKEWLKRRDTNGHGVPECQFPGCGRDKNHLPKGGLHCHHIIPAGYYKTNLVGLSDDPHEKTENFPENGIMLCADKHHNGAHGIHPDYAQALQHYRDGDKDAFKKVAQEHAEKEAQGEIYWNPEYDHLLYGVAVERTEEYLEKHPEDKFPFDK